MRPTCVSCVDLAVSSVGRSALMSRVLFVDDLEDLRELFEDLLTHHGHEVVLASDGESALAALETGPFDIVFVDIGLPGMDGFEVARRIRLRLGDAMPHLVAMTGFRPEPGDAGSDRTFDLHLVKPVESAAIVALVEAAPSRAR